MGLTEDIADKLAREALKAAEAMQDDKLVDEMAQVIGASSTTMEEAFLTAVRVRRAEARARALLIDKVTAFKAGHRQASSE